MVCPLSLNRKTVVSRSVVPINDNVRCANLVKSSNLCAYSVIEIISRACLTLTRHKGDVMLVEKYSAGVKWVGNSGHKSLCDKPQVSGLCCDKEILDARFAQNSWRLLCAIQVYYEEVYPSCEHKQYQND